jgi:hypothetical protein
MPRRSTCAPSPTAPSRSSCGPRARRGGQADPASCTTHKSPTRSAPPARTERRTSVRSPRPGSAVSAPPGARPSWRAAGRRARCGRTAGMPCRRGALAGHAAQVAFSCRTTVHVIRTRIARAPPTVPCGTGHMRDALPRDGPTIRRRRRRQSLSCILRNRRDHYSPCSAIRGCSRSRRSTCPPNHSRLSTTGLSSL